MKKSYKTSLFTIGTIVISIFTMSSFVNKKTTPIKNLTVAPTAYKNLITYQEGDMYVYSTSAVKPEKMKKFQQVAAKSIAAKGMVPSSIKEVLTFSEKDPSAFYEQDLKSGTLSFSKGMDGYYEKASIRLPDPEKAKDISLSFLKETGLAPANLKELKMMHSGGLRASAAGSEEVMVVLRTITYGRMLNGVPVYGAGSKIIVHVGNKGEIVGVKSRWKEVEKTSSKAVGKSSLKNAKQAEMEMQRQLMKDYGKEAKFKIKDMYLAYYDGGKNYIQPAYFFQVDIMLPKVKESPSITFDYIGIVSALNNPPEAIAAAEESPQAQRMIKKTSLKGSRISNPKNKNDID
ncbi:hypothetical protein [Aequorivita marisscotiae]|uniref:Uncharacterized protein n=1 Tax=Aequorivita marisscotiae TaxID=3040348 RepID=A0ABY8KQR6_9FLAO|nr:hypothetical protein [Aequorivita sp. Ant34-E75]WGF91804.1 hypothetical protein QCQ61_11355 [Aequorivita sp. Ant34-E75]